MLYDWYLAWLGGRALAHDANHSLLALIPKQYDPMDAARGLYRHPRNLRPLSLSNTDVKILALALNAVAAPLLPGWARQEQKGFVNGRVITQNVINVESHSISAALRVSLGDCPQRLANPAAVFFDFGAAFPSLAQLFLWALLRCCGIPDFVIAAVRELYRDNRHYWQFGGSLRALFTVRSGVKQGCPFSTALFVLAMDPFVAALAASIGPSGCLRVYADDIAIVLWRLTEQARFIDALFRRWTSISALRIRHDKCVVVPLWTLDLFRARALVLEMVPFWGDFLVDLAAKYLGYYIGPEAHLREWAGATGKFMDRATNLLRVEEGLLASIHLHNLQALPVFHYVAQLRDVPDDVCRLQDRMVERLSRGPRRWLPLDVAYNMNTVFRFPSGFHRLQDLGVSIKVRASSSPALHWREHHEDLRALLRHDLQALRPPHRAWVERSAVATLSRARDTFFALLPQVSARAVVNWKQRRLYDAIRMARGPPLLETILRKRWSARWSAQLSAPAPFGVAVRRACRTVEALGSALPPFLLAAVVCTWLNGWCTAHRFQSRARCPFCWGPSDSLEHLAGCAGVRALLRHHLNVECPTLGDFFGVCTVRERFIKQALGLHAVKAAVEGHRLAPDVRVSASARFRAALLRSAHQWPPARRHVSSWTPHPLPARR